MEYTVTFEVLPEVPPIAWEKLHLVRYKPFVSNECVEKKLEQIAGECTASRPYPDYMHVAQKGDTVIVDAELKLASGKGTPQKLEDMRIELVEEAFIKELIDCLVGLKRGDAVTCPWSLPSRRIATKSIV